MKFSFSNRHWSSYTVDELIDLAVRTGVKGIEIHDVLSTDLASSKGPFGKASAPATVRKLYESGVTLACFDCVADISDPGKIASSVEEINTYIDIAADMRVPYIRLRAAYCGEGAFETAREVIKSTFEKAEASGITMLIETAGFFSNTERLCELLNDFATDTIAALWDIHHPYIECGEDPELTIKNLGAYIKHIHVKDSCTDADGNRRYCLIGEGDIPVDLVINALSSVNFSGLISLEWDPDWMPEISDPEVILTHFMTYMERFSNPSKSSNYLYENRARTGKFVWKKETLIDKTFSDILDRMVEEFPDQCAFKYTTLDYTRTYREFRKDVDECARALISLGVKRGSHVAVWCTNLPQWYITFWATVKIGAVLVTVNTAYKIHEAEYLLRQSDTHTLVMIEGYRDSNYSEIIKTLCPELENTTAGEPLHSKRLPFLRNVITIGFSQKGCLTWDDAMERAGRVSLDEVKRMAAAVSPHDVCNMQYTSGTTGFPKGVMLTHYNIVNNGKCIGDRMDLSTADRMMIHVPMFHCFGMVLAMTASMTHGTSLFPLPYFSPRPSLACIHQEHITCFHGVPTMFIAMLEHEDFEKTDFSYMRTGIMAGSPCPISKMKDVVEKMHMSEITIVYGQTEASPGCTMSSYDDPLDVRVGTVGKPLPEIECKVINPETGEECAIGENGEFVARGYNIMKGYYKMPKATSLAIDADGWLHTGDLAAKAADGNYRITGRLKDMIIRGGENIYPKEIEEFIYTHPKVKDVQVIGVPDEQYGEEIMACIILKEDEQLTEKEMKDYILAHMAKHKVPKYIDFVKAFPTNAAGKILKYKMREDAVIKLGLQKAAKIVTA